MSTGFTMRVNGEEIRIPSRCSWYDVPAHERKNNHPKSECADIATYQMVNYRGWVQHHLCQNHKVEAIHEYCSRFPQDEWRLEEIAKQ